MIGKLFVVLIAVANLVLAQNTTCPSNEGYTSLYPVASPLGTGWRCPGQQYTADFNGQVYSVDLWLSPFGGGGGNIYLEVYDALTTSSTNLVATSASIPGPSSGSWVTFTFSSTWTQTAGSTYYFYPRDPNPSSPRYSWTSNYWSNSSPLGSECAVYWCYGYALDCRNRFAFRVNYNKDSCCTPGCFNGGICQADGTCVCPTGYPLPSCLNTCAGSVSYTTNSGISMPMGSSWLCPGQEYKATQNGTVSSIALALDPFSGPGGNVYVEVYSAHSLSSTLIATSASVAGPTSSGTFTTFTFATPWTQVQGQNYYFYPRDPTPSNPSYTWVLSSSGSLTEECLVTWCGNVYRDCRWRGKFIVNYSYSC